MIFSILRDCWFLWTEIKEEGKTRQLPVSGRDKRKYLLGNVKVLWAWLQAKQNRDWRV